MKKLVLVSAALALSAGGAAADFSISGSGKSAWDTWTSLAQQKPVYRQSPVSSSASRVPARLTVDSRSAPTWGSTAMPGHLQVRQRHGGLRERRLRQDIHGQR